MSESSKQTILQSIRRHLLEAVGHPDLNQQWIQYPDLPAQFAETLAGVGGRAVKIASLADLNAALERLPEYTTAKRVYSWYPGVQRANVRLEAVAEPHELQDVDFAILPGQFGVAENGAVWVTEENLPHRAIFFIPQHLALVIPAASLVSNMYEAYQRIPAAVRGYSGFLSGPSKTADIEQSLVIGAQGPRSLTAFLAEDLELG